MLLLKRALGPLVALLLGGCAPVELLNALTPSWGYAATNNLAYGSDVRQTLDVYRPANAHLAPVIIFFYGSRWEGGNKRDFRFVADAFTAKGYVVVIPDYRIYPQVTYPAFVNDGASAVRWAHEHVAEQGGDPNRLFLVGHSSGGHTAVMLALDAHYLRDAGVPNSAIRGTVGLAGPYDFLPFDPDIKLVMGPEAGWPDTQPINHVRGDAAPMLLLQGDADDIVKPPNATHLEERQRATGADVTRKNYAGIDHYRILLALAAPLRFLAPVLDDVTAWLARHGGVGGG
jgi:acetyl esterase/lipase